MHRHRLEIAAGFERTGVDRLEADLLGEFLHGLLGAVIVAGDEHHRLCRKVLRLRHVLGAGGVERFHHAGALCEQRDGFTGGIVKPQFHFELGRERIGGVDHDLAFERSQRLDHRRSFGKGNGEHDHIRGFCRLRQRGNGKAVLAQLLGLVAAFAQGVDDVMLGVPRTTQRLADIAGSNDCDFHETPPKRPAGLSGLDVGVGVKRRKARLRQTARKIAIFGPPPDFSPCCTAVARMLANPRFRRGSGALQGTGEVGIPSWIPMVCTALSRTVSGLRIATTSTGP